MCALICALRFHEGTTEPWWDPKRHPRTEAWKAQFVRCANPPKARQGAALRVLCLHTCTRCKRAIEVEKDKERDKLKLQARPRPVASVCGLCRAVDRVRERTRVLCTCVRARARACERECACVCVCSLLWVMQKEMKRIEELKYLKDVPRLAKETTDWPELLKCIERAKVPPAHVPPAWLTRQQTRPAVHAREAAAGWGVPSEHCAGRYGRSK